VATHASSRRAATFELTRRRWRQRSKSALIAGAIMLVASPARADVLSGKVQTTVRSGATAAAAVVYAEPLEGTAPVRGSLFKVTQKNKTFLPRVLGVPLGSTVSFPNDDGIFHNVFSLSSPQPFDLGLYRAGATKDRVFAKPATYRVFCNIHPQMAAFIVVAPSPWVTTAGGDGGWRLDVPPGRYRVTALSERAPAVTIEVTVAGGATTAPLLTLDESTFAQTPHLNKFGREYPKEAYKTGGLRH
jgi:plastocyanin